MCYFWRAYFILKLKSVIKFCIKNIDVNISQKICCMIYSFTLKILSPKKNWIYSFKSENITKTLRNVKLIIYFRYCSNSCFVKPFAIFWKFERCLCIIKILQRSLIFGLSWQQKILMYFTYTLLIFFYISVTLKIFNTFQ